MGLPGSLLMILPPILSSTATHRAIYHDQTYFIPLPSTNFVGLHAHTALHFTPGREQSKQVQIMAQSDDMVPKITLNHMEQKMHLLVDHNLPIAVLIPSSQLPLLLKIMLLK